MGSSLTSSQNLQTATLAAWNRQYYFLLLIYVIPAMSMAKLQRDKQYIHLHSCKTAFLYWTLRKRDYEVAFVRCYYKENGFTLSPNSKPLLLPESKTTLVKCTGASTEQNSLNLDRVNNFNLRDSDFTWTSKKK